MGRTWLVEVSGLDVMTQGKTKADALSMLEDAVLGLMTSYFNRENTQNIAILAMADHKNAITLTCSDTKLLLAFFLQRQREISGSMIMDRANFAQESTLRLV